MHARCGSDKLIELVGKGGDIQGRVDRSASSGVGFIGGENLSCGQGVTGPPQGDP